jgi:hypothetical protein
MTKEKQISIKVNKDTFNLLIKLSLLLNVSIDTIIFVLAEKEYKSNIKILKGIKGYKGK